MKINRLLIILSIVVFNFLSSQSILNTKHDLSVGSSSANIKAISEEQVCVFCHTPHSSDTIAQLWNKIQTEQTNYTIYLSERLAGYHTPSQPNDRSKLCMSCHDGTIAIGSVYNLPGSGAGGVIIMSDGVTTMPISADGYIGIDLSDDHPVGYSYDTNYDSELIIRNWPWKAQGLRVLLDPDASNGTIECHTCHNPHDNFYSPFLNEPESMLCTVCHVKTEWEQSVHYELGCSSCHKSHSGEKALLISVEEINCYSSGCHGSTIPAIGTTGRVLDVETQLDYVNSHPTNSIAGVHFSGEISGIDFADRHAECGDCHDPHQAGSTTSSNIASALTGVRGVESLIWPTPTANLVDNENEFIVPSSYSMIESASEENQICLKCHSNFTSQPAGQKNIAEEINPYYRSTHGLVKRTVLDGSDGTESRNPYVNSSNMEPPFDEDPSSYTRSLQCSDCHASEISGSDLNSRTDAKGSHGSSIFVGSIDPLSNQSAILVETISSSSSTGTPLCFVCHSRSNYWDGPLVSSAFDKHPSNSMQHKSGGMGGGANEGCFSCHMWDSYQFGTSGDSEMIFIHGQNKRYNINEYNGSIGSGQLNDAFVNGHIADIDFENKTCQTEAGCHQGAPWRPRNYNSVGP
ncbi:hypothetical protein KKF86_07695 [bacterium]|nr:hypothetical protein [bacterium]